jgi:hypothetical protein
MLPSEEDLKRQAQNELNTREMERQAMDPFEVYNPLDHDFVFMQNRFKQIVKAHSTKQMPRSLARHYAKKIVEAMINDQIALTGEALKKKREEQMGTQFLDKYVENVEVWNKVPKVNDPELVALHMKMLRIRKLADYGMEPEAQQEAPVELPTMDNRSSYERAFDDVADSPLAYVKPEVIITNDEQKTASEAHQVSPEVPQPPKTVVEPPLYKSKATLAKEAAEMSKI